MPGKIQEVAPEIQAEIVIRLMSNGKVGIKFSDSGPIVLFGMLEATKMHIHERLETDKANAQRGSIITAHPLPPKLNGN